jgi:hypothetical protein
MTKMFSRALMVLLIVSPVALIADDKKETPEQTVEAYDTLGALQVKGETTDWFTLIKGGKVVGVVGKDRKVAANRNNPDLNKSIALFAGTYTVDVNVNLRKIIRLTDEAKVEAGKNDDVEGVSR